MATIELKVPDIGDFKDVEVIELLVSGGDEVSAEQSLLTVESDKASMEIPASTGGRIVEMRVRVGDRVSQGSVIALLEVVPEAAKVALAPGAAAASAAAPSPAPAAPVPARAPQPAPAGTDAVPVLVEVPDIGDFTDVEVIELLVAVGDRVAPEQSLMTVESDKASMEIPSTSGGIVVEIMVKIGDRVSRGSPIAVLAAGSAPGKATDVPGPSAAPAAPLAAPAPPPGPVTTAGPAPAAQAAARTLPVPTAADDTLASVVKAHASPSVRKFARELGVALAQVSGTGPKQRITQDDVRAFVKAVVTRAAVPPPPAPAAVDAGAGLGLLPWPKVDFAKYGPIEARPLPRIRKLSAANLHRNWVMIPHVTNHEDADVTGLEAFRVQLNRENEKSGVKLTMLAFLVKAVVHALQRYPDFNASLDGDSLVHKRYWHIGFAADTPNGLVVPVIRDADRKGLAEIARETADLAGKARDGKLSPSDMQGGTFSISSLGGIGGTSFTPIINAPEVAILGVSRTATRPVWNGSSFEPRLVLPLSLSYDHRVIDGAAAARFNAHLAQLLADFRRVML